MLFGAMGRAAVHFTKKIATTLQCPMLRHIPQPLHAGGLEADVGVEAAGDGAVDDGLLLLLQQLDQLLLGADVAPYPPVGVVEEADNGGLFGERRERAVAAVSSRVELEVAQCRSVFARIRSSKTVVLSEQVGCTCVIWVRPKPAAWNRA